MTLEGTFTPCLRTSMPGPLEINRLFHTITALYTNGDRMYGEPSFTWRAILQIKPHDKAHPITSDGSNQISATHGFEKVVPALILSISGATCMKPQTFSKSH